MAKSRSRPSCSAMQKASGTKPCSTESQARLYVIVHFARHPCRYLWDFAIHDDAAKLWTSYSAGKTCESEYPISEVCEKVPEPEISNCHTGYLELAKIPSSRVPEIEELCNMVPVPEVFEEAPCSHQYVRNMVNDLIDERIICQATADNVFVKLDERNDKLRTRNIRPHYREKLDKKLGEA